VTAEAPHVAPSLAGGGAGPVTDFKSAPLAQVETHLGYSPDGLSTAEAEERQAGNAIEALKAKLAINARELVPGDLIRLRLGDIVPADARLGLVAVIKHAYLLGG
jgi:hypothetical protein